MGEAYLILGSSIVAHEATATENIGTRIILSPATEPDATP